MELPHQDGVARQLETLADRCRDEIAALKQQPEQGEPTVKDEIRFYTSQLRAFDRALGYWLLDAPQAYWRETPAATVAALIAALKTAERALAAAQDGRRRTQEMS